MPREKNTFLRVAVPVVALALGIGVAFAVFRTSKPKTPVPASGPAAAATNQPTGQPAGAAATTAGGQPTPTPAGQAAPADWTLRALINPDAPSPPALGSVDPASTAPVQIEFSGGGAGLARVLVNGHYATVRKTENVVAHEQVPPAEGGVSPLAPFSAMGVSVTPMVTADGAVRPAQFVRLYADRAGAIWSPVAGTPGAFEATIVDQNNAPVLRIRRQYTVADRPASVLLTQSIENLSPIPLTVEWYQLGPIDMPFDGHVTTSGEKSFGYGGDKRWFRFGYLMPQSVDPTQRTVQSGDHDLMREKTLGPRDKTTGGLLQEVRLWPNETSTSEGHSLVWVGTTNRHFATAVFPLAPLDGRGEGLTLSWVNSVTRVVADGGPGNETPGLRLDSKPLPLAPAGNPGAVRDLSLGIYAGPLDKTDIRADARRNLLGLTGLVVYNFGGICAVCTFAWVAEGLLWFLHVIHDYVTRDWAMAIIILVIVVRTFLHPVTRWSQIRMSRWGKQMAGMAPKMKEIQERYKNDPRKAQAETAALWREEGVSPAGLLGCLPGFLQSPIWIALSATLYFAVELRHQGAFYGVFQAIQPQTSPFWGFLADLGEPDALINFGRYFHIPLLSTFMGPVHAINVLPIILGVVFYIQQKYLTPPTAAPLTPEQEMQQTMVKWMMVFMFPLAMYNAPSGLALYFVTNTTLAIIESKWIRAHMDKHGLLDLDKIRAERKAKRKPTGESFLERMAKMAEEQQKKRGK